MRSRAIIVSAILGVAMVSGGWLIDNGLRSQKSVASSARLLDQVMHHVRNNYVDTLGEETLYRKAVDGMLYELRDPHTVFLTAERLARLTERTSGHYAGIGVQIDVRDGWIVVVTPLPNSPAERAGIQTGDRIVEIKGQLTRGWTPDEASAAIRGPVGTKVEIAVELPGVATRLPFTLERRDITVRSVPRSMVMNGNVGYVHVTAFSSSTVTELTRAVDSLRKAGATSLIVDLRGNPGGLLDQGVGVSDLFLDRGQVIVETRGRTPPANQRFSDEAAQRWPDLPVVVLVNAGSASASEIVAGALQDHDRALVVGQTTFGKGSAQSVYRLGTGGALKLTTARWFTPVGRSISKASERGSDNEDDDPTPLSDKPRYKTDGGRVVYGGGGIIPDVFAGDSVVPQDVQELQDALGRKVPQFRDALTDYALSLRGAGVVKSRDFTVTAEMREELWRRMQAREIQLDRATYDKSQPVIDRLLGAQVARYVFGPDAEFLWNARTDAILKTALSLAAGAGDVKEPFERASRLPAPRDSTGG
jgi:carboxyl-terminal processing protease